MASLTANGIDTAVSTTALRGAIVALTAPTDGARIAMESAGIEAKRFDDGTFDLLETVKQFEGLSPDLLRQYIPDIRATIAISSLANNIDGLSDNLDAFANKTGATSKAFDIMAAEFNTQMAMLKNTTQSIMIEIGSVIIDAILPSITEANGELAKLGDIGWDVVAKRIVDGSGHIRLILKDVMDIIGQEMFIGGQRALARLPRLLGGISDKEMENNIAVAEQLISSKVRVMMIEIDALHQKISEPVAIDTTEWFTPTEMGFDNTAWIDETREGLTGISEEQREMIEWQEAAKIQSGVMVDSINKQTEAEKAKKKEKEDALTQELRQASLVQVSAKDAMKAVVRAESMEAVAGLIASILKTVPFPFNIVAAAGAGGTASGLIDKGLSKFAKGGDFITDGPQMIMVGDNSGGRERVQVTPLSSPNLEGPSGGININFNGPVTNDSYVRDFIIPEIQKQTRLNLA
jgi:hypothetical protein